MPLLSESVMPILAVWTNESAQLEVLVRLDPCDQLLDSPCVEDTESVSAYESVCACITEFPQLRADAMP